MLKSKLKLRNVIAIAICLAGMTMFMSGCEGGNMYPNIKGKNWQMVVTFVNRSSDEIHLYGESEVGGPGNKLQPGGSRTRIFTNNGEFPPTSFTATAFKNGAVVSTHSFPIEFVGGDATLTASYPW